MSTSTFRGSSTTTLSIDTYLARSSLRFVHLSQRLASLRRTFVPRIDPIGDYTEAEIEHVKAYRVLVHAEFETYFEDFGISIASDAFDAWCLDRRPRSCLVSIAAFHVGGLGKLPEELPALAKATPGFLRDRIETAKKHYCTLLREQNHGIREDNLMQILLPIGIREFEIDRTWLSSIDSYGRARGEVAHGRTQQPPDALTELGTVEQLLSGLRPLDEALTRLAREN
jgi:hypothetical protein